MRFCGHENEAKNSMDQWCLLILSELYCYEFVQGNVLMRVIYLNFSLLFLHVLIICPDTHRIKCILNAERSFFADNLRILMDF